MSPRASCLVPRGLFVTGTDTGVGKTLVAAALLRAFASRGLRAIGMKPVAAGALRSSGGLVNEDVEALALASSVKAPRDLVNPYCFEPAMAPHLAAEKLGQSVEMAPIVTAYAALAQLADRVIVEGAGGLLVPLNGREDFADLARALGLPLVLVVGMRLGCLNHALLTAEVAAKRGLTLAGWVANTLEPCMMAAEGNLATLRGRLPMPLLGILPYGPPGADEAAKLLDPDLMSDARPD
ncbi:MAG: dethiobiotin synthase [Burkholderiales bacterium]